jgi:hypothetical protein
VVAYVRTVKTRSGAIAVQIVWSSRRGSRSIEHVGSAHDESELEALKVAARQRLAEGQGVLDLGLDSAGIASAPLEIVSSHAGHLWDALCRAYTRLGLDHAAGSDEVFRDLVLARIIEPTSKQDSLRVLCEVGVEPVSYRTVTRRLPVFAKPTFRQSLSAACARLRPTLNPTGGPSRRPVLAAACSRRPPRQTGCRNHEATECTSAGPSFTQRRATATDIAWLDEQLVVANPSGLIRLSSQADQNVAENRWTIEDYDVFDVWRHRSAVGQLGGHPGIGP